MDTNIVKKVLANGGGCVALARSLKISKSAVSQWRRIPVGRVLEIERITGVSRHEMRPDIYGVDPALEEGSIK